MEDLVQTAITASKVHNIWKAERICYLFIDAYYIYREKYPRPASTKRRSCWPFFVCLFIIHTPDDFVSTTPYTDMDYSKYYTKTISLKGENIKNPPRLTPEQH